MTFDDIVNALQRGKQFPTVETDLKMAWQRASVEITTLYTGVMPSALQKAFPNESERIRKHRQDNYAAITKETFTRAIKSMYKFFSKSKYSIDYQNDAMRDYIEKKRFGELSLTLDSFFFRVAYPNRVLDPNGCIVVMPIGAGLYQDNTQLDVEIQIVAFDRVEYKSNSQLIYKPIDEFKTVKIDGIETTYKINRYILTTESISFEGVDINAQDKGQQLIELYQHGLGFPIWHNLGGRYTILKSQTTKPKSYFESDFAFAIPFALRTETFESLFTGVALEQGHPTKVAMTKTCDECDGEGDYQGENGESVKCKKCNGSGEVPLGASPQEIVTLNLKGNDAEQKAKYATIRPVYHIPSEVNSIKALDEIWKWWYEATKKVLNIERTIQLAQSGTAKEIDKEEGSIEIDEISEQFFQLLEDVLKSIQGLVFMDNINDITVHQPIDFLRKSEAELFENFQATITSGSPYDVRLKAYKDYLQRKYNNDKVGLKLAEITAEYAPLYLYSIEQRNAMLGVDDFEKVKPIFAHTELLRLYADNETVIENKTTLFTTLDAIIKEKMPSVTPISISEFDDNDENDESE